MRFLFTRTRAILGYLMGAISSAPRTRDKEAFSRDPPAPPGGVQNVEQLRAAIDSGSTKDKVAVTDPAAAPLGSDAEAAGLHDEQGLKIARDQAERRQSD